MLTTAHFETGSGGAAFLQGCICFGRTQGWHCDVLRAFCLKAHSSPAVMGAWAFAWLLVNALMKRKSTYVPREPANYIN